MKFKKQLNTLAEEAPQYGIPSEMMEKAVNPVLAAFARPLRHEEYYILQNHAGDWAIDTLSHRQHPQIEKKVIYAFGRIQDAIKTPDPGSIARAIPVTHLLFQLFALGQIDGIIFLDEPGNLNDGIEITRTALQDGLQHRLKQLKTTFSASSPLA